MDQANIDTKALFAPKKGKQATKGQKQIFDENKDTIRFYSIMAALTVAIQLLFASPFATTLSTLLAFFAILVQLTAIAGMYYMARPVLTGSSKTVKDGGIDLNLKGGFADYLKDLIITTSICSSISVFSNGFWLLWLWLPGFLMFKVWTSVIAPWIFQPAPEENVEVNEKKKKKMERKMARANYR